MDLDLSDEVFVAVKCSEILTKNYCQIIAILALQCTVIWTNNCFLQFAIDNIDS